LGQYKDLEKAFKFSISDKKTKSSLGIACAICGRFDKIEIHHVKHLHSLKDKWEKNWWKTLMIAMHRKQIALCLYHHHALHNHKLTSAEQEAFGVACRAQAVKKPLKALSKRSL